MQCRRSKCEILEMKIFLLLHKNNIYLNKDVTLNCVGTEDDTGPQCCHSRYLRDKMMISFWHFSWSTLTVETVDWGLSAWMTSKNEQKICPDARQQLVSWWQWKLFSGFDIQEDTTFKMIEMTKLKISISKEHLPSWCMMTILWLSQCCWHENALLAGRAGIVARPAMVNRDDNNGVTGVMLCVDKEAELT